MSLYDRLVPAEALRWGRLTRPWLELDAWMRGHGLNPTVVHQKRQARRTA